MRRGGRLFVNLPVHRRAGWFILRVQQTVCNPGGRRDAHVALPGSRCSSLRLQQVTWRIATKDRSSLARDARISPVGLTIVI